MTNKIKALGLAFVAIAAMSAIAAQAAQAGSFDIGVQPAVITGHSEEGQKDIFTVQSTNGNKFDAVCTHSLEATTQGLQNVQEITATTTKTGCTLFGMAAQVRMNGCKDTFTGAGQPANTFLLDIVGCTVATPYIQIQTAICQIRIPEQNGISHVVGSNLQTGIGQPHEVTLTTTASGITITQIGAGCPDGNNHHSQNGSSQGNMILKAFQDLGGHLVTKHAHQYIELTDGAQVNLTST
jgi:hypothetical protein